MSTGYTASAVIKKRKNSKNKNKKKEKDDSRKGMFGELRSILSEEKINGHIVKGKKEKDKKQAKSKSSIGGVRG